MHSADAPRSHSLSAALRRIAVPALPYLAAAMLGVGLVWLVGFAPYPAVHDAFHDLRHAAGFPCH